MVIFENVRTQKWFKQTKMMGHVWAKEKIELIESYVTKENIKLWSQLFEIESTDWSYFSNISKSYIDRAVKLSKLVFTDKKLSDLQLRTKLYSCMSKSNYFTQYDKVHVYCLIWIDKLNKTKQENNNEQIIQTYTYSKVNWQE